MTLSAILLTLLLAPSASAHPADVELIPPGRYVEVAVREIKQAKRSIHLIMYLIALPLDKSNSAAHQLVEALVEARARGVNVRVILDENMDWRQDRETGLRAVSGRNALAAQYLHARGVQVFFDEATTLTHAKTLVIDETTTILGSANWSEKALTHNVETNALIRSAPLAREVLAIMAALPLRAPPMDDPTAVPVPWAFLSAPAFVGRMATAFDEGAFDLYLYLLRTSGGWRDGTQTVGYAPLAVALGVQDRPEKAQRMAVRKVLYRLQNTYRLLTVAIRRNQDPVVTLTALQPTTPDDPVVRLPAAYWDWGWDRHLPLSGKVMYSLGLHYAAISPMRPVWFRAVEDLAARHGFARRYAQDGFMALRRRNLLEVQPGPLQYERYGDRPTNRYLLNSLYDPARLAQQAAALGARYGQKTVRRVTAYAALVYEDHDVDGIERLIQLEEAFGPSVVRAAARKVGALHGNNPKRSMVYLIRTIEWMGRRHQ